MSDLSTNLFSHLQAKLKGRLSHLTYYKNFNSSIQTWSGVIVDLFEGMPLRRCIPMAIVLAIAIFGLGKILYPLELKLYDFNFQIRPTESTDERIVIVEWDETSIQMLEETIVSDHTLFNLLNKIKQQQPRVIGLDLYRDIPVLSPQLSDAQNIQAYNSLNQLWGETPNLIGIEKVIEPIINPPLVLSQKGQTTASDIDRDRDDTVRRAYIFPQLDELGSPAGIPYLGVVLGYQYLEDQGWKAKKLADHSLLVTNGLDRVKVKPLESSSSDRYGLDMLINWRKGKSVFRQVSVTEVISNQIPPDLFRDRIVLIGNVSASTADRHNTPLDSDSDSWTYGVQIPAHVASSIVSAALDRRPLMRAVPQFVELSLVIISALSIMAIAIWYRYRDCQNLYLATLVYALGLTIILLLFNLTAFWWGWWLPVTTGIGAIWICYFFINYYIYREQERKNTLELKMFVRDLQHNLGNILNSIASSANGIEILTHSARSTADTSDRDKLEAQHLSKSPLTRIKKRADNISRQVAKMGRYRKRTEEFVDFSYLSQKNQKSLVNINQFVSEIVARFEQENEYEYRVYIRQIYDSQLDCLNIDRAAIEIVLENLLDNAFYSVAPTAQNSVNYTPLIEVQTKLNKTTVEFSIKDNGVGIPPSLHQKIFRPFVSFNYGQGIGLYLCKKILSLYRGKIKVESIPGQGSKFSFTIPLC